MRFALGIEYDGTAYKGWQTQGPRIRTIQGVLERALSDVADSPVSVVCAGRTDAGVHAIEQVAHFDTESNRPERAWVLGVNSKLPADVSVRWSRPVAPGFHARFSANARRYRYLIQCGRSRPALNRSRAAWHWSSLDVERMNSAARHLLGEHDFSAFRAAECQAKHPVRTITRISVRGEDDRVVMDVEANAFLHHMVRNIVGALMPVGRGERPNTWTRDLLKARDRKLAGVTAPACGLYLVGVRYSNEYGLPNPQPASIV